MNVERHAEPPDRDPESSVGRFLIERIERALPPLREAIGRVPPPRLVERPVPDAWPVGLLIGHALHVVGVMLTGVARGRCDEGDVEGLPEAEAAAGSREALERLADEVEARVAEARGALSPGTLSRAIRYYFGAETTGLRALELALTELLHHRGQIQVYLRLMGLEPVEIYASDL